MNYVHVAINPYPSLYYASFDYLKYWEVYNGAIMPNPTKICISHVL